VAVRLGLIFGEPDPGHFGVGVGHGWDHAGVEGGGCQFLVALQFTGDHFGGHMRFVHRLVRQHGLAHDVADGEDVRHVGAHLDVHGLQHQVVHLRCGGRNACVASSLAPSVSFWIGLQPPWNMRKQLLKT